MPSVDLLVQALAAAAEAARTAPALSQPSTSQRPVMQQAASGQIYFLYSSIQDSYLGKVVLLATAADHSYLELFIQLLLVLSRRGSSGNCCIILHCSHINLAEDQHAAILQVAAFHP